MDVTALIIDDNHMNRALFSDALRSEGFEVEAVDSGYTGLDILNRLQPDIILLDIMMPTIDGYEVLANLSVDENHSKIPIIVLSAMAGVDNVVKALSLGATDYLRKPVDINELLMKAKLISKKYQLERERDEDMRVGAMIQRKFLMGSVNTSELFKEASYRFSSALRPAGEVSGDFWFPKYTNERGAGLFFADVCGHGVGAALISTRILSLLDHMRSPTKHPSEFLEAVNHDLVDLIPADKFVAANYLIANENTIHFSNAGQPSAIHIRGDKLTSVEQSGPPLGMSIASDYIDTQTEMRTGDKFVLITDGVIEAANSSDEIYGIERLMDLIEKHSDAEGSILSNLILEDVLEYSESYPDDDVSIIVLEKTERE